MFDSPPPAQLLYACQYLFPWNFGLSSDSLQANSSCFTVETGMLLLQDDSLSDPSCLQARSTRGTDMLFLGIALGTQLQP